MGHNDDVAFEKVATSPFFLLKILLPAPHGPCPDGQVSAINPSRRPFKAHTPPTTWLSATGNRQIRAELEPVGRRLCQKKDNLFKMYQICPNFAPTFHQIFPEFCTFEPIRVQYQYHIDQPEHSNLSHHATSYQPHILCDV